jgi:hypothetical protein
MKGEQKMKKNLSFLKTTIMCLSVVLWCLGLAEAERADWKVLQKSSYGGTFSYDAASVKRTESDTITVWAQSDAGKYLYEIDCKNKKARILQGLGPSASEWFNIASGSGDELVYKAVCP